MIKYQNLKVYYGNSLVDFEEANLNITSSAVLYGLSVYTVFPVNKTNKGMAAFRLPEHYKRLIDSSKIIGIDTFDSKWNYQKFKSAVTELISSNNIKDDAFVRATVHVVEQIPGTRSRGLKTELSIFIYPANPILPPTGARIKSSVWRRVPDYAIPARAKVNGAYVNSVLAKQDALDSGYDDCVFLDGAGHVCELSAANIFLVKNGKLITPDTTSDLLEGINRKTILEIAKDLNLDATERTVDLTELYTADEVFACGTSAFIAPILDVDSRQVGNGNIGPVTAKLSDLHNKILHGQASKYTDYLTSL